MSKQDHYYNLTGKTLRELAETIGEDETVRFAVDNGTTDGDSLFLRLYRDGEEKNVFVRLSAQGPRKTAVMWGDLVETRIPANA